MRIGRRTAVIAVVLTLAGVAAAAVLLRGREGGGTQQAAPLAIPMQTADGRALSLADFRGRYVLLNLWATWCPPCVKEMPSLDRLQAMKGDAGFEVVALSIDRQGKDVVAPFYQRVGLTNLAIYLDQDARSMAALRITGLPTTLLIDPNGHEIARWPGAREWDHPGTIAEIDERIARSKKSGS